MVKIPIIDDYVYNRVMELANPTQTSIILRRHNFRLIKDLGQNFLIDANISRKIIAAAEIARDDVILEIGPGIGALTNALAKAAKTVIAVEVDKRLTEILGETLAGCTNTRLIMMDAMDVKPDQIILENIAPNKLVANLPYNIAAPVVLKYFSDYPSLKTMIIMVQREIADRILADKGNKIYGAFTLKARYFCQAEMVATVPKGVFIPPPNVGSAILKLKRWEKPPVTVEREPLFNLITAAFSQRRKQLVNAVSDSLKIEKSVVEAAVRNAGLPAKIRAEELGLDDFTQLLKILA